MSSSQRSFRPQEPWFVVRQDLSGKRTTVLSFISFALPLAIWAAISYLPFLWHPDIQLQISADREDVTTVYIAGDRVSKGFFPEFVEAVREQNQDVEVLLKSDDPLGGSTESSVRRANKKVLRHLAPVLVSHGIINEDQSKEDSIIYQAGQTSLTANGFLILLP